MPNLPNELTVKQITSFKTNDYNKQLKKCKLFVDNMPESSFAKELAEAQDLLDFVVQAQNIIKKYKLKVSDKVAIAFHPKLKSLKEDKLYISKLGGVPSCFYRYFNYDCHFDAAKFKKALEVHYWPKSMDGRLMKYIGDFDTQVPTKFMNDVMPEHIVDSWSKRKSFGYFFDKRDTSSKASEYGSLFVDQNFGQAELNPDGVFKSMLCDFDTNLEEKAKSEAEKKIVRDRQAVYFKVVKEFINKKVNPESYSVDTYKLQEITGWTLDLEVPSKEKNNPEGESLSVETNPLFKLFGYARSQQTAMKYYCVQGYFGPRLMNTFLTFFSQEHDNFIQIYADILGYNSGNSKSNMYIKTDISST